MGCSNGSLTRPAEQVDERLPFSRADIADIQAFWQHVKRRFEETARENLLWYRPYFQVLFPALASLKDEQDMLRSVAFETQAVAIFNVYDYAIDHLDRDIDGVMHRLEQTARVHAKIEHFYGDFFQYLEEPLMQALREKHFEKFKDRDEELMRTLFRWMQKHMTLEMEYLGAATPLEMESLQYQGTPAGCNSYQQ